MRSPDSGGISVASASQAAPDVSLATQEPYGPQNDLARYSTKPLDIVETPRSPGAPITPHPPMLDSYTYPDIAEQTTSRLSEAAQFISEVEPSNRRLPRASRLAPIRDISADIRRESTPLPRYSKMCNGANNFDKISTPGALPSMNGNAPAHNHALHDDNAELPDLWPWLDGEIEEKESEDSWANGTDPLISRHIPNSIDSARIEEEDIKRALAEGIPTNHLMQRIRPRRAFSLRTVFAILAILAALALIADGILLSVVVSHPRRANPAPVGPATAALTLSPNVVVVKKPTDEQLVHVHIVNFPAGHSIQLSHDVQEDVKMAGGSSLISTGKNGSADATIIVNSDWHIGFDLVYAEDITTHYIASTQLQVIGAEPSKPARLVLLDQHGKNVTSLDFGTGVEGSNAILPLTLENSGSGSITWSASSDQSWLLVTPGQGMFSQSQKIAVVAQRINLKQGKHTGTLTISSSVSTLPQTIQVTVNVGASIPGPVLAPTPAVLSFTTTDGSAAPPAQLLTLNNPGTQPLIWSLSISASTSASNLSALGHMQGASSTWLSADITSGTVLAGSSQQIHVSVNSNSLLPGAYVGSLLFSAPGSVDGNQTVSVSLTVQPNCSLVTNAGYLSFTAVQGQTNPSNQSLSLNATASCAGAPINWKAALSSSGWLSATPTGGTLMGTTSQFVSVGANAAGLPAAPRPYYGFIAFTTPKSTQTVVVTLTVQPQPTPGAPVMSASPLNLNFSSTQGQPNPKGQVVTITNTGGSPLKWNTNVATIATSWLNAAPSGGTIQPDQTGQLVVNIDTSRLSPGTYAGQITLNGLAPASGGGQVVSINLVVQPPCTLTQPSSSSLAFSGVQNGLNPASQSLLITGTGNCSWPLTLSASVPSAPWLTVQFPAGNTVKGTGQSLAFVVGVNMKGLISGSPVSASFTISATDSAGTLATGSPQLVAATLTVSPPCVAAAGPNLTFTAAQGLAPPAPQSISLSETGTCSRPVNWTAGTTSTWLSLSTPAPDTGSGSSLIVSASNAGLTAGTYTGTVNLSATDSNGISAGSKTITVTLTVTPTYSVGGTVTACTGAPPACLTPTTLPGATLTLLNSSNATVATITADGSGNFTFANLPPGNYTVNIIGTIGSVNYATSGIPLSVTGNATGVNLNVYVVP
ncbi:MAG TPA: carboxypeptidase regulatory-like domain-containing protein [Ktedonobacteraceae bacterium]|nr:carboxypeptidase regulatory-like domain-containing protein [Ktedonobacteraceae bacterium]